MWHDNYQQPFSSHGIQDGDQNELALTYRPDIPIWYEKDYGIVKVWLPSVIVI